MVNVSRRSHDPALTTSIAVPIFLTGLLWLQLQINHIGSFNIGNVMMALGCVLASVFAVHPVTARPVKWSMTQMDWAYLVYLIWIGLSALWSPSRIDTLGQLGLLTVLWFSTTLLSSESLLCLVRYLVHSAFIAAILSLALIPFTPDIAFQPHSSSGFPELRGIMIHQLLLGLYMCLAGGALLLAKLNGELDAIYHRRTWLFWPQIAFIGIAAVLAIARLYSMAALLAFLLTIGVTRNGWRRYLIFLAVIGLVVFVVKDQSAIMQELSDQGIDVTLSGRTRIWERSLAVADLSPMIGHGFASFNEPAYDWIWPGYRPPHPHNSYIQAYFETGFIGLGLLLLFVWSQIRTVVRNADLERRYSYSLFFVTVIVVGSLTGAEYAAKPTFLFGLSMLAVGMDGRRARAVRAQRRRQKIAPRAVSEVSRQRHSAI